MRAGVWFLVVVRRMRACACFLFSRRRGCDVSVLAASAKTNGRGLGTAGDFVFLGAAAFEGSSDRDGFYSPRGNLW